MLFACGYSLILAVDLCLIRTHYRRYITRNRTHMKIPLFPLLSLQLILLSACGEKPREDSGSNGSQQVDAARASVKPITEEEYAGVWIAASSGDVKKLKDGLDRGLDVNVLDPHGSSILITAVAMGQLESVKLILEKEPDLEIRNKDQNTALSVAAFFCQPEVLEALIDAEAYVNPKDKAGSTPLDVATAQWSEEFAGIYKFIGGILKMDIDLERIRKTRPKIAEILKANGGKSAKEL
jgi:uncharacterized protein